VTAYCLDNSNLAAWTCPSCKQFGPFTVTAVMDDGVNQGYVGYFTQGLPSTPIPGTAVQAHEPFVLVSFRGTVPTKLSNWIEVSWVFLIHSFFFPKASPDMRLPRLFS